VPLLDGVAAAFQASTLGAVEGVHGALLLALSLLLRLGILGSLVLSRTRAADHDTDSSALAGTTAAIDDTADYGTLQRTRRALTAAYRRT